MNAIILGIFDNFVPLFSEIHNELVHQGHKIYFVNPRNYEACRSLDKNKIGYFFKRKANNHKEIFTSEELEKMVYYQYRMLDYNQENPKIHQKLMRYAREQSNVLDEFISSRKIDQLIVWNGAYLDSQIAIALAKKNDIPIIFFENGFFPRSLQIDHQGINFNNSIASMTKAEIEAVEINQNDLKQAIADYKESKPPKLPKTPAFENTFFDKLMIKFMMIKRFDFAHEHFFPKKIRKLFIHEKIISPKTKTDLNKIKIKKPYIFLPLQVHDDSQILLLSPLVSDMYEFIDTVYQATKETFGDKYQIVVKEHPVDRKRGWDYSTITEKYPDIIWLRDYNILEAIEGASLVVTINSTVGFESLIFNKAVVSLGKAFYNREGLAYNVTNKQDLPKTLEKAIESGVDKDLVDKFIYYLRYKHCIMGSFSHFDKKTVSKICARIETLAARK